MIAASAQAKQNDSRWVAPEEIEFNAENTLVTIVPKFKLGTLYMVEGEYGPFVAQNPVEVPLWLAVHLKKTQRANIKPPEWLDVDHLSALLDSEKRVDDGSLLKNLPFHYIEIAQLFFSEAPDDVPNLARLQTLIEDITNIRQTKLRKGMEQVLKQNADSTENLARINVGGISALEVNKIRPSFLHGLEMFWKLQNMYKLSQSQAEIYNNNNFGNSNSNSNYDDGGSGNYENDMNTNSNVSRKVRLRQIAKRQQQQRNNNSNINSNNIEGEENDDNTTATTTTTTTTSGSTNMMNNNYNDDTNPFSQDISSATVQGQQQQQQQQQSFEQTFEQDFEDT